MIHSKTAFTYEIDDPDIAVEEVLGQLQSLELNENMLGIVACSYDYIETGVIAALSEALPFHLVGQTSVAQSVSGESGMLVLTLMVLYSDDCTFTTGVSDVLPVTGDMTDSIRTGYEQAKVNMDEKEKLIIAFMPIMNEQAGDDYVNALSSLSGRTPIFGAICADDTPETYANARTIYDSEAYSDRISFVLISGNVDPHFRIISVSEESVLPFKGEITRSQGNVLLEVNHMPVMEYMESIGLAENGKIRSGIASIPFLINFSDAAGSDNVSVARAMYLTVGDGVACVGSMPEGASLAVGMCDKKDVQETTRSIVRDINAEFHDRVVLMITCFGRRLALTTDPQAEVEIAMEEMSADNDFMMTYSSGEICPTSMKDGLATNRFHNYTIAACIL